MVTDARNMKSQVLDGLLIVAGCVLMGLAYSLFLIPHHFVPGGVSGIAMIINYFTRSCRSAP